MTDSTEKQKFIQQFFNSHESVIVDAMDMLWDLTVSAEAAYAENKRNADRADAAERELAELREQNRWIPVTEKLPDTFYKEYDVIIHYPYESMPHRMDTVAVRRFTPNGWDAGSNVTHWKERPKLPQLMEL